jgi:hypothetical protein
MRRMSKRDFEALPLRERVQFLIEGSVQFFSRGAAVSPKAAMRG